MKNPAAVALGRLGGKATSENITLSNGRVVKHNRKPNGSEYAGMADGGVFTEPEWEEYCSIVLELERTIQNNKSERTK